mmetsp:Transcript_27000/g.37687  ORF Transcript_27000/g.37687 Transcript_27000/m.37687 type:complete len:398 (+) Transcript_27000:80-1273(+)
MTHSSYYRRDDLPVETGMELDLPETGLDSFAAQLSPNITGGNPSMQTFSPWSSSSNLPSHRSTRDRDYTTAAKFSPRPMISPSTPDETKEKYEGDLFLLHSMKNNPMDVIVANKKSVTCPKTNSPIRSRRTGVRQNEYTPPHKGFRSVDEDRSQQMLGDLLPHTAYSYSRNSKSSKCPLSPAAATLEFDATGISKNKYRFEGNGQRRRTSARPLENEGKSMPIPSFRTKLHRVEPNKLDGVAASDRNLIESSFSLPLPLPGMFSTRDLSKQPYLHGKDANPANLVEKRKSKNTCRVCLKVFAQRGNLTRHLLIHAGSRPFKCSICPKTFNQKVHLTKHERTHTGERPYRCPTCLKWFAQRQTQSVHMQKFHGYSREAVRELLREQREEDKKLQRLHV